MMVEQVVVSKTSKGWGISIKRDDGVYIGAIAVLPSREDALYYASKIAEALDVELKLNTT